MTTKTTKKQKAPKPVEKPAIYQWTDDDGQVLVLRFSDKDGRSYNGFQHPMGVGLQVVAPDFRDDKTCGGGIHGWPWGIGLGDGKEPVWDALWQVYSVDPKDLIGEVGSGPKCKFRAGTLVYMGDWHNAMQFILPGQMKWAARVSEGAASNSGDRGAASNSGQRGAASNSGYQGAASNSGYQGAALGTGSYSSAETMAPGTAAVVTGHQGKAKAAEFGCIALAWWNEAKDRYEMRCALVGVLKNQLKADTWYQLDKKGNFMEVK